MSKVGYIIIIGILTYALVVIWPQKDTQFYQQDDFIKGFLVNSTPTPPEVPLENNHLINTIFHKPTENQTMRMFQVCFFKGFKTLKLERIEKINWWPYLYKIVNYRSTCLYE